MTEEAKKNLAVDEEEKSEEKKKEVRKQIGHIYFENEKNFENIPILYSIAIQLKENFQRFILFDDRDYLVMLSIYVSQFFGPL